MTKQDVAAIEGRLSFTGDGSEYFRIWVVNTLLSLVTLGIYSAWAKVRKASYFARNTRLAGDTFDFVANPWAILRGRVIALLLLGLYSVAFEFSLALGVIVTAVLVVIAPVLVASATRFRLRNTRWRGMRFDFSATPADAYRALTLVVLLWVATGSVVAAVAGEQAGLWSLALLAILLPWMHHCLKAFQHGHARVAGTQSSFRSALGRFYGIHLQTGLIMALVGLVTVLAVGGILSALRGIQAPLLNGLSVFVSTVAVAVVWLAAWPYFAARVQAVAWHSTTLGPLRFRAAITYGTLLPVAAKSIVLLVATAGLYWPYAAIAWARCRIDCMRVVGPEAIDALATSVEAGASSATLGEGALDFFGIDVGW